jgi:hypothetical protein
MVTLEIGCTVTALLSWMYFFAAIGAGDLLARDEHGRPMLVSIHLAFAVRGSVNHVIAILRGGTWRLVVGNLGVYPRRSRSAPVAASLGMVLSDEFPGDGADAGLKTQAADDAFQCKILRPLADQGRPDLHLARRIHVFAVQRAQAEP